MARLALALALAGCVEPESPPTETNALTGDDRLVAVDQADLANLGNSTFTPRTLASPAAQLYIVKLSGTPVALAQAGAGRALSGSERQAVRDRLAAEQGAVEPRIVALGGRVLARYRDALDGLRIQIAPSQVAAVQQISGVVSVKRVAVYERTNTVGVPFIGAPAAWTGTAGTPGVHGEGVKVAIIDTGIDYTHATFGGPGTPEAFAAAAATSTAPADPALFGPAAPKVKGGTDLVGDAYQAGESDPVPDSNPLDCGGHGTHVAGTAAGFGVLADGTTYPGPYDGSTHANSFLVGPGVAPRADLYAVRVFGCEGSTDVVVDALDWSVANQMDVINMSLGSSFGSADSLDAEASDNAAKAGIVVVASAGNSGGIPYIQGAPASASRAISVAAVDSTASFPGAVLTSGPTSLNAINANGAALPGGSIPVKVLRTSTGAISLGCNPAEYAGTAGMLVVTARGVCARVARAVFGQQAGAAAVLMVNNANSFPPYEGTITGNPDTGEEYLVTIPFLGVRSSDASVVASLDGKSVTLSSATIANPAFRAVASFSSLGPRTDGHLKPDVSAPGVAIVSALIGSGTGSVVLSGTSMAAPHTTGLAALARQAHPTWPVAQLKAAIMNTSNPGNVTSYRTSRAGTGLVSAPAAVQTQAVAFADGSEVALNFGILELGVDFAKQKTIKIRNNGASAVTFDVASSNMQGSPHGVSFAATQVTVPAGETVGVDVTVMIPAATAGNSGAFREIAGLVRLTPTSAAMNGGHALRVPYYAVVRGLSNMRASIARSLTPSRPSSTITVTNTGGVIAGTADVYAWGLSDSVDQAAGYVDLRAVGAQSFPAGNGRQLVVFAVNMNQPWSFPNALDVEIPIDSTGDGNADYVVVAADLGLLTGTGAFDGRIACAIYDVAAAAITRIDFLAVARTNSSTILMPIYADTVGVTAANPRFLYSAAAWDLFSDSSDYVASASVFNAFTNAISTGAFVAVPPGGSVTFPVSLDTTEWASSPALGSMVVGLENQTGTRQADLIAIGH